MISSRENIKKFRLSHTELNVLIHKLAADLDPTLSCTPIDDYHILNRNDKTIVIFPMSTDEAMSKDLEYIGNVIRKFREKNPGENCLLLLPMRMSQHYLPFYTPKRKHAVLVEIDLKKDLITTVKVHDSQGNIRWFFYPDELSQIALGNSFEFKRNDYHAYGVQESLISPDVVSCGYYVYEYIKHIVTTGASDGCEKIRLDITNTYNDKWDYFEKHHIEVSSAKVSKDDKESIEEFDMNDFDDDPKNVILAFELEDNNEITLVDETSKLPNKNALSSMGMFSNSSNDSTKEEPQKAGSYSPRKF